MLKSVVLICAIAICSIRAKELYEKCGDSYRCAEQEIIKVVDDFDKPEMPILGSAVVIEKNLNVSTVPRSTESLIDRIIRYIEEHQLTIKFPAESARKVFSGKKSLGHVFIGLLALKKSQGCGGES